jgi:hypothetical protein
MTARTLALGVTLAAMLTATHALAHTHPGSDQVGKVHFPTSCQPAVAEEFDRAVAMLHSFWFEASTQAFTRVLQQDPGCAMAHWGIAMNRLGNPFGWPPPAAALSEGLAAVEKAVAVGPRTERERDYIAALATFYREHDRVDHRTRAVAYTKAMEQVAARYPDDREAAIFAALALNATALPTDKTYANQLRAAAILEKVFAEQQEHPGVAHYLIHSYDYPPIAEKGLTAARKYAAIAPAAPHALHMPSHIFTRRGHWQESIDSNLASKKAATNQFDQLHAMDYLAYAYLQQGRDDAARRVLEELRGIPKVTFEHFVAAYALAAVPSRYALERGRWSEAAGLALPAADFAWQKFPQAEAVLVFARGLGAARAGDVPAARRDLDRLVALRDRLLEMKVAYWAEQVDIQHRALAAWIARAEGKTDEALAALRTAAEMEAATEKHPVTPGPVLPAREQLGEMLLEAGRPAQALEAFEKTLESEPDRFRALWGAARAAELSGDRARARAYYGRLLTVAEKADTERPEIRQAKAFVAS